MVPDHPSSATINAVSAPDRLSERLRRCVDQTIAALAVEFARFYADYNYIHPFREGSRRTGTTMLHIVAALCRRRLDLSAFLPLFTRALD